MKKLVFMFVAMAAMTFAACGGQKAQEAAPVEEVEVDTLAAVDSLAADTLAGDSVVADSVVAE